MLDNTTTASSALNTEQLLNRKKNLRCCERSENDRNRSLYSCNTSGVAGVYFDKERKKWVASITYNHNKTILDTISQDKVDAWDGAVTKQHEHANKTVLDGISAEKVADWDSKAAGNHEHDITELKQASGYIVFNCGSASVNI